MVRLSTQRANFCPGRVDQLPSNVSDSTGSLRQALVDFGVLEEQARLYAEGVNQGGILLAIRSSDERAAEVVTYMERLKEKQANAYPR